MIVPEDLNEPGALMSPEDVPRYRYALWRPMGSYLENGPRVALWVMLNPSTADWTEDDPTIRRVAGFSAKWECTSFVVVNLFAFRATDPAELYGRSPAVIIGPENNETIAGLVHLPAVKMIVVGWGAQGDRYPDRVKAVAAMLPFAHCLGITKTGQPKHPLYLAADTPLIPWGAHLLGSRSDLRRRL